MDIDDEGKGTGQLAMGVQLAIDEDRRLVIKSFGTEPVRLQSIRQSKLRRPHLCGMDVMRCDDAQFLAGGASS